MGYDLIHETLAGAEDLAQDPTLAASTAQASPDPMSAFGNAQTTSQAANYDAAVKAIKQNLHHITHNNSWNVLGDVAHFVQDPAAALKTAGGQALQALSKPLEDVQHEYRYIKDIYQHHHAIAALSELVRLGAGAAVAVGAGALDVASAGTLTPATLAVMGAGATTLGAHTYQDSWDRSAHESGSPGRDFANLIHFDPSIKIAGHRANILSGSLDAMFDIATDPVLAAGNGLVEINRARYALTKPEDLAVAYKHAPVERAVNDIVKMTSPTQIMERYRGIGPGLASQLARAKNPDDVFQAYADHWVGKEYMSYTAPRLSFVRGNFARPMKDRLALLGIDTRGSAQRAEDIISGEGIHGLDIRPSRWTGATRQPSEPYTPEAGTTPLTARAAEERRLPPPKAPDIPTQMGPTDTIIAPSRPDTSMSRRRAGRGIERVYRRITTHLPLQVDEATSQQITHALNPIGPTGIPTIRDWAKYGNNRVVANAIADAYARADVGQRLIIIRNLQVATAAKMGMADHPEFFRRFLQNADDDLERNRGFYGVAPSEEARGLAVPYDDGFNVEVRAADGSVHSVPASIWTSQMGSVSIPNFREYRRAIDFMDRLKSPGVIASTATKGEVEKAATRTISPYRFDDFMYNHLTRRFKKLALTTGGFALRIGTGEALREILNSGVSTYARGMLASLSNRYISLMREGEEASGFRDRLSALAFSGADKLKKKAELDFMIKSQIRHDGAWLPPMIDGHHGGLDVIESRPDRMGMALGKTAQKTFGRRTGDWRMFTRDEQNFHLLHRGAVQQVIDDQAGPVLARMWKNNLAATGSDAEAIAQTTRDYSNYLRTHKGQLSGLIRANPDVLMVNGGWDKFAETRLRALRGLTEGPTLDDTGRLLPAGRNNKLIEDIGNGRLPSAGEFRGYNLKRVPEMVPGQAVDPYMNPEVGRLFNAFHHRVTAPVMNTLSRRPTFAIRGAKEYERLQPYVEARILSEDDAMDIAEHRAALAMLPDIHNPLLRTQFHQIIENYAPFLFAKQQAFQRWGRLIAQDPGALRKLEIMHSGMKNIGFIQKDPDTGEEYFAYPYSGFVGGLTKNVLNKFGFHTLDGVPLSFRGSMTSFRSILPGVEEETGLGLGGPLFFTSVKALQDLVPESAPLTEKALGQYSTQPIWAEWLPNPLVKNFVMAYAGDHSRAFYAAMMFGLQDYYSRHPEDYNNPDPTVQMHALTQAKNLARTVYIMKAILGESLPAAPQFQIGHPGFSTEFSKILKENTTHNYADALDKFQKRHPNIDVSPYTVFQSTGPGVTIPPSKKALDFFESNHDLLRSLPDGGAYLIPQDPADDSASQQIYNEQVALGLRKKKTPDQFIKDLYAAAGDREYYEKQRKYTQDKKDAVGNTPLLQQLASDWQNYVHNDLALRNPTWADKHFGSDVGPKKERAIVQLQALFDAHKAPPGEQTDLVHNLLNEYNNYKGQKNVLQSYRRTRAVQQWSRQLDLTWQSRLNDLMNQEPRLIPIIQGLFFDKALAEDAGITT